MISNSQRRSAVIGDLFRDIENLQPREFIDTWKAASSSERQQVAAFLDDLANQRKLSPFLAKVERFSKSRGGAQASSAQKPEESGEPELASSSSNATASVQKSIAAAATKELERNFPALGNLRAAQERLHGLQPVLERAVARLGDDNMGGPITMSKILSVPGVKSHIAFVLYNAAKRSNRPLTISGASNAVMTFMRSLASQGRDRQTPRGAQEPDQSAMGLPMAASDSGGLAPSGAAPLQA